MESIAHDRETLRQKTPQKPTPGAVIDAAALERLDKAVADWMRRGLSMNPYTVPEDYEDERIFSLRSVTPDLIGAVQKTNPGLSQDMIRDWLVDSVNYRNLAALLFIYRWRPMHEVKLQADLRPDYITITEDGRTRQLQLNELTPPSVKPPKGTRFESTGRGGKRLVLAPWLWAKIGQEAQLEENRERTIPARQAKKLRGVRTDGKGS